MGYYTDVILVFELLEPDKEQEQISHINKFFENDEYGDDRLIQANHPCFGLTILIGTFNALSTEDFLEYLRSLSWGYGWWQLMIRSESLEGFKVISGLRDLNNG